jgi:ATP-dependent helicase/nuclease subunit B
MDSNREFDAVVRAACDGATVVTGNTRATRFLLSGCDEVLGQNAQAWRTPDILPLTAWVQRTFREAQVAGATPLVLLNNRQSLSLWKQSIADSPGMTELLRPTNASGHASSAWALVHGYRVPLNQVFETTTQSKAFLGWARRYQQTCSRRGWTDAARVVDELAKIIGRIPGLLPRELHLWGCGELNAQQEDLLGVLKEARVNIEIHECRGEGWEHVVRVACVDSTSEVKRAAAFARKVLRENPEARVGVVIPRLREQRSRVEAAFSEVLSPEFYTGGGRRAAFEIAPGQILGDQELVKTATRLLRFAVGELKHQELRELLMSPYLGGGEQERGERARLCRWLGENGRERVSARRFLRLLNPAEHEVREAEALSRIAVPRLRRILAQIARVEGLPTKAGMSDWATQLGKVLREAGWPGEEDRKLHSIDFQIYTKWLELLSDLASLDVTQGPITFPEAVEELRKAAAGQTFAPENLGCPVQVMDMDEAEGSLFDHLWICGLDDETWPQRRSKNAFIPAQLLRAAKVPGSTPESQAAMAKKELSRLLASAPNVVLSHAVQEGDRKLRVSPAIETAMRREWSELEVAAELGWSERMRGSQLEELMDANAPAFTDAELLHRGSGVLEKQAACPFRAFAELRLGASASREPGSGIEPTRRGKLIEEVLEIFWIGARDLNNMRGLATDERERLILSSVERAMQNQLGESETQADVRLREIERERLAELANEWLQMEEKRAPFDQVRHQQSFEYEVSGVRLRGRIDRIDRSVTQAGEIVIDYKTGGGTRYSRKSWETPRPRMPQLPLYAAYLQSQGKDVVGVGFALLNTAKSKVEGMSSSKEVFGNNQQWPKWARVTLREQIETWTKEIEKLVSEHLAGDARVDPKVPPSRSGSSCEYCHLHAMCRISEAVVIDEDEECGDE